MNSGQMFGVLIIAVALTGMWLESQCLLGQTLTTIQDTPNFAEYVLALIAFLVILSLIGEPYSSYLAGVTVLGLIYLDFEKNGNENVWSLFRTS